MGRVFTTNRHYSLPDLDEADNVPADLKTLADAIDADMATVVAKADTTQKGGIGGIWPGEWLRLENGIQFCRYTGDITGMVISEMYGALYSGIVIWKFPKPFVGANPAVCCGRLQWGTAGITDVSSSWGTVNSVNSTSATIRALDAIPRTEGTATASFFAYGMWK